MNIKEGYKVWLAKYALSGGITEDIVRKITDDKYCWVNGIHDGIFVIGRDIFPTKQEAINKANEMRDKKIKSLEKQIEKLKKMTF